MAPAKAKGKTQAAPAPVKYDYSGLSAGLSCQAQSYDGNYYACEIVQVSTSKNRSKAPVKVNFKGYASSADEWVGGDKLRCKALKKETPQPKATAKAEAKDKAAPKKAKDKAAPEREPRPKLDVKENTVLLVSTSSATLKGHQTGVWLEELASPYYKLKAAGFEVLICSPRGGAVPIDTGSMKGDLFTADSKKFLVDAAAMCDLSHSHRLNSLDFKSANIKGIFVCGGHGACVDLVKCHLLKKAIELLNAENKPIAAVCHGVVCLVSCKKADGTALVQDVEVTGFSNTEEEAVQLVDKVPFPLETKLKELGAKYEKGGDWTSTVKVAGNLITGQNPQSSAACADALIKAAKK